MRSSASSVDEYLEQLPEDKREVVTAVRKFVRKHLPKGYEEAYSWGMLSYEIPLKRYPDTYNKQPLGYVALASQKNYYALYLMGVYQDPVQQQELRNAFEKAGKKMDMGKSCLRFKKLDDLPLDALGKIIASTTPEKYIERYETTKRSTQGRK